MQSFSIPRTRPSRPRRGRRALLSVGLAFALAGTACSQAAAPDRAPGTADAGCVQEARSRADAAMQPMDLQPPGRLDTAALRGKSFAFVALIANGDSQRAAAGAEEALRSVGADLSFFDGKGTPDVIAQGVRSAVGRGVDGIIAYAFDPTIVRSAISDAAAAGIPVIDAYALSPEAPLSEGVAGHVSVDAAKQGQLQADYALANTGCDLHTSVLLTTAGQLTVESANGTKAEVETLCPTCTVDLVEVNAATYATTLAGQMQTTLQRAPDMNYVISSTDIWIPYILQAASAVGRKTPSVGGGGSGLAGAIGGNGQVATVQWPPFELAGYYIADAVLRAAAGAPASQEIPMRVVDATNWGQSADVAAQFPDLAGVKAAFRQSWGVG